MLADAQVNELISQKCSGEDRSAFTDHGLALGKGKIVDPFGRPPTVVVVGQWAFRIPNEKSSVYIRIADLQVSIGYHHGALLEKTVDCDD